MRSSRIIATTVSFAAAALIALVASVSPALAETHPFLSSFGSFSNPNGIAVDTTTDDVYVADIGTDTVYKFDASGDPVDFAALGSNALTGAATPSGSLGFTETPGNPAAIAVDDSASPSDPSAGDLYVMDVKDKLIDKFDAEGKYLGQITGPTPKLFASVNGLAVDDSGNVWVDDSEGDGNEKLSEFDDSAGSFFVENLNVGTGSGTALGYAVGPLRDNYLLSGGCDCLEKFGPPGGGYLGLVSKSSTGVAVAVDQATGHVYIDEQSSVSEWNTGEMNAYTEEQEKHTLPSLGTLASSFGSLRLAASTGEGGIAVNSASGDVYVANPTEHTVDVFATATAGVSVSAPVDVAQTTATLEGAVDPHGDPVDSCRFEYGTTGSYGQSVPCEQTPAQIESGTAPVAVSADVSGLQAGLLYDFRLSATNANGSDPTTGRFVTAGPGFGINAFEVSFTNENGTPDTQAGSHPYEMATTIALNTDFLNTTTLPDREGVDAPYVRDPDGNVRDFIVTLPPGLVGDPNATTKKCTPLELDTEKAGTGRECPAASRIGYLEVELGEHTGTTVQNSSPVFNMVPPRGVPAQFGAHFVIPSAYINAEVKPGGDYGVRATSEAVPTVAPVIKTRLVLYGIPPQSEQPRKPFLTLPTSCNGPLPATVSVDSYQDPGHFVSASTVTHDADGAPGGMTGCSKLIFPPTISVEPDVPDASTSTGLTVGVHVSQKAALNPEGLAESTLRDTTVTLPEGVALNPAGADGLESCSEGLAGFVGFTEFNPQLEPGDQTATFSPEPLETAQPGVSFCPNGSKIGTVKIKTPLLPNPIEGTVYLASQGANPFGSLVAMYLIAEDPVSGTLIKLPGEVSLSPSGQIVTTFKNTPQLPFEELELHFFGGERAPLTTPSRCGTYTTQASFTPWDGNGPVDTSSSFQITAGPNGGPCPGASLPFSPSLAAGTTSIQAGGFSPFTMTMSRRDGEQNLQAIQLHMPAGLSGLLAGVELCPEPQASEGLCPANSLIGETIVSVGVGGSPFSVKGGKVYITGPYEGAPFGLSIVNPAKAGPYDLEDTPANHPACDCLLVRAKIEVNPITAALTVTSNTQAQGNAIPTTIEGIPLQIQHVNVTIDRPNFIFNPTNCDPMNITGSLSSTEGATDALTVPFQATNCATLAFKPQFSASTSGHTSRADGASLRVKLSYPKAPFGSQANIQSVKVDLPRQLPSRLSTLQQACTDATFESNPANCPVASRVGTAIAITPLVPVALTGPAYFVSHGGAKFPELVVVLQGYGITIELHGETFISRAGITSSTFRTVPDQPVSSFELTLPEGKGSALAANGNLCTSTLTMPTAFTAQNGATLKQSTPILVTGCKPAIKIVRHSVRGATVTILASVPSAGKLSLGGSGLTATAESIAKAGTVTATLRLTRAEQSSLSRHAGRRLRVVVSVHFKPKHGASLTSLLTVLVR